MKMVHISSLKSECVNPYVRHPLIDLIDDTINITGVDCNGVLIACQMIVESCMYLSYES